MHGWEYGMLRSFEQAIIEETGAETVQIPQYNFAKKYFHHFGHGMRRGKFRQYFPKQSFQVDADIGWYILMGPEDYRLDVFNSWDSQLKLKILYLYDTFPSQYDLIKTLTGKGKWDILITSFNDAVDDLQKITGQKWYSVPQAADRNLFQPAGFHQRLIHFSSYGRRYPALHEAVKQFSEENDLCYDYTTHDAKHPVVNPSELYKQYAWHLNHSLFTFSWPVELTNPVRAGHLHPVTCRWFEALAAGTIVLGKKPANNGFNHMLDENLIIELNPDSSKNDYLQKLAELWGKRETLFQNAQETNRTKAGSITWNERVRDIVSLTTNETPQNRFSEKSDVNMKMP